CQLQDLSVGYGGSASRYREEKRVVFHKDIGPLVSMQEMARCIHCTRCVRFGQEIAGVMELGMAGRGEHSEILSFVGRTVDSELSGNMIDLCPVGALTSKPFRYAARTWELARRKSVAPHDGLGSNLVVQVKQDTVMRVLPLENEAVNECWLSDRDRFSYEGLNSEERLTRPMVKVGDTWQETDWQTALETAVAGLSDVRKNHGAEGLAALASPDSTLEELHLLNQLVRGLGSNNIDTRLRQPDTSADGRATGARWLGMPVSEIGAQQAVLLIGSTIRKEHPLIAARLRAGVKKGLALSIVHAADDDLLMNVAHRAIVRPSQFVAALGGIAKALAEARNASLPAGVAAAVAQLSVTPESRAIAQSLHGKERVAVLVGNLAQQHPDFTTLHVLAQEIARLSGGKLGFLVESANGVGAAVVGAEPGANGFCAQGMVCKPRKGFLLMGMEPADCHDPAATTAALKQADFVVALSMFKGPLESVADVLLPIAPFTETSGTFVSMEGRVQSFNGVVKPRGEARPAWKVLRVLGNQFQLAGFGQESIEQVRAVIATDLPAFVSAKLNNLIGGVEVHLPDTAQALERVGEVPLYSADALVRRAPSLQKTSDAKRARMAWLARDVAAQAGVKEGDLVTIARAGQDGTSVQLTARIDAGLAAGCVRVAAALDETLALGAATGAITLAKAAMAAAAE
ncbi:MAG: NADH-quinone oxidoreductase subunit G, partial [Betaproteobacteria bacterium]|nr:NADH-quinone oxidoreductase subunit G [Betaproteobacteria bacterium]